MAGIAVTVQVMSKIRQDDAGERAASWIGAEREPVNVMAGKPFRIRIQTSTNGLFNSSFARQIQYSKNLGSFVSITGATSNIKAISSTQISDEQLTTAQLSNTTSIGGPPFQSGGVCETSDGITSSLSFGTFSYIEDEFCLFIVPGDVVVGDSFRFRLTKAGSTYNSYTLALPTVAVIKHIPDLYFYPRFR